MTQHRLLQQAAAWLSYQGTCRVFVIGAVGNGMQISPLSVSVIIYSFTVNEKSEKGPKITQRRQQRDVGGPLRFVYMSIAPLKISQMCRFGRGVNE